MRLGWVWGWWKRNVCIFSDDWQSWTIFWLSPKIVSTSKGNATLLNAQNSISSSSRTLSQKHTSSLLFQLLAYSSHCQSWSFLFFRNFKLSSLTRSLITKLPPSTAVWCYAFEFRSPMIMISRLFSESNESWPRMWGVARRFSSTHETAVWVLQKWYYLVCSVDLSWSHKPAICSTRFLRLSTLEGTLRTGNDREHC